MKTIVLQEPGRFALGTSAPPAEPAAGEALVRVRRVGVCGTDLQAFHDIGGSKETVSFYHLANTGWEDVPGGEQRLCYNELPTKLNWHYVRIDFDLATMSYTGLRCNDREFDLSSAAPMRLSAMPNLWCMFQPFVFVETDADKRAFLYVDSAVLSAAAL